MIRKLCLLMAIANELYDLSETESNSFCLLMIMTFSRAQPLYSLKRRSCVCQSVCVSECKFAAVDTGG